MLKKIRRCKLYIVFFSIIAMENQRSLYQLSALSFFPFSRRISEALVNKGFIVDVPKGVVMGEGMMLLE